MSIHRGTMNTLTITDGQGTIVLDYSDGFTWTEPVKREDNVSKVGSGIRDLEDNVSMSFTVPMKNSYVSRSFLHMLGAHVPPRNPGRSEAQRAYRMADSERRHGLTSRAGWGT